MTFPVTEHTVKTARHTTGYLACGAEDAPLLIFCHGWPELSLSWRHQLPAFAALGFRCVAPDMRGYGRSSTYTRHEDFAQELIVEDMLELLRVARPRPGGVDRSRLGQLGGVERGRRTIRRRRSAWRAFACPISRPATTSRTGCRWSTARSIPIDLYPVGQWDYHFFYEESFDKARADFEANIRNVGEGDVPQGQSGERRQAGRDGVGAPERRLVRRRRLSRRAARRRCDHRAGSRSL